MNKNIINNAQLLEIKTKIRQLGAIKLIRHETRYRICCSSF